MGSSHLTVAISLADGPLCRAPQEQPSQVWEGWRLSLYVDSRPADAQQAPLDLGTGPDRQSSVLNLFDAWAQLGDVEAHATGRSTNVCVPLDSPAS